MKTNYLQPRANMSFKKLKSLLFAFPAAAGLLSMQTGCQTTPAPGDPGYAPDAGAESTPAPASSGYAPDAPAESTPGNDAFFSAPGNDRETDQDQAPALEPAPPVQAELEPVPEHQPQPREDAITSTPIHASQYTVVRDDTLWRIAHRSGISLEALQLANDLSDTDVIRPGQELTIPSDDPPSDDAAVSPASDSTSSYRVERGDTLSGIALRFNTRVDEIMSLNNLADDMIRIGQRLELPGDEEATESLPDPQDGLEAEEEISVAPDPVEEIEIEDLEEGETESP
ncbi:MAG: LysM peptidoglycan-binding domain-containing protein [Opitutales bacterium]